MSQAQIFISHSSTDADHASELAKILRTKGFKPWLAKFDIALGSNFAEEITRAIKESGHFIVLLSKNSIASPHVKREVSIAVDKGIPLLPVIIGGGQDFVNTMPEEWIYWLTVVQVVQYEDSTQTANEIVSHINSGKLASQGLPSRKRRWFISRWVAAISSLFLVAGFFLISQVDTPGPENSIVSQEPISQSSQEPAAEGNQTPKALSSKGPREQTLDVITKRLNKSGSITWKIEEKIEFPIGEIGRIQSSDFQCELSIFPDLRSANYASDDRNYTTNAYIGWLDKDRYSSYYIIMTAIDGDTPCGRAASKAFGWPIKVYLGETFLEGGATPFDKCLIAQVREYGGTKEEAIGPCKFQFERDGKAIPEQYLNLG
jgi:hypothetical protein